MAYQADAFFPLPQDTKLDFSLKLLSMVPNLFGLESVDLQVKHKGFSGKVQITTSLLVVFMFLCLLSSSLSTSVSW